MEPPEKLPHLHEVAHLVGDPYAEPTGLVRGRPDAPDHRSIDVAAISHLADRRIGCFPHAQHALTAAVPHAVRDDLVDRGGTRSIEPERIQACVRGSVLDEAPHVAERVGVEPHLRRDSGGIGERCIERLGDVA